MITQLLDTPGTAPDYLLDESDADPAVLLLDGDARVLSCSARAERLFGYRHEELVGSHVSRVLPEFAQADLLPDGRLNPRVAFLCHCGRHFRALRSDGSTFAGELHFVTDLPAGRGVRMLVRDAAAVPQLLM